MFLRSRASTGGEGPFGPAAGDFGIDVRCDPLLTDHKNISADLIEYLRALQASDALPSGEHSAVAALAAAALRQWQ